MTGNRLSMIWELVAEQAAVHGSGMSAGDACAAAVAGVQVTGAWLSAGSDRERGHHLMRATDEVSRRLAELQLTLGEGPSLDAFASGAPALASDLADGEAGLRWPAFAPAAGHRQARPRSSRSRWQSGRSGPACSASTGTGRSR